METLRLAFAFAARRQHQRQRPPAFRAELYSPLLGAHKTMKLTPKSLGGHARRLSSATAVAAVGGTLVLHANRRPLRSKTLLVVPNAFAARALKQPNDLAAPDVQHLLD
jgi:hypothetical protein